MIRAAILFTKISIVAAMAFWLANNPGQVTMQLYGYHVDTSFGMLILLIAAIGIMVAAIWRLWHNILTVPQRFSKSRELSRREKGYQALTKGLVAVAAGDAGEAAKQSRKANALLNDPPLTMLLSAQSAQLAGDDNAAVKYFTHMLDNPEAAFLGIRGLMVQAIKSGNKIEALSLAKRAYELHPKTQWVLTELLTRQSEVKDWDGALKTLDQAVKSDAITIKAGNIRRAELLMEKSRVSLGENDEANALRYAMLAQKNDAELIPAITAAARILANMGKNRKAEKLIEKIWQKSPSAALAQAYDDIASSHAPLEKLKYMQQLAAFNMDDIESHIMVAQASLKADIWGEARKQLTPFAAVDDPRPRICRLMAQLEEAENNNMELAHAWLEKASRKQDDEGDQILMIDDDRAKND